MGHMALMGDRTDECRVLVGRPEGKMADGRSTSRYKNDIKVDLQEAEYRKKS